MGIQDSSSDESAAADGDGFVTKNIDSDSSVSADGWIETNGKVKKVIDGMIGDDTDSSVEGGFVTKNIDSDSSVSADGYIETKGKLKKVVDGMMQDSDSSEVGDGWLETRKKRVIKKKKVARILLQGEDSESVDGDGHLPTGLLRIKK